MTVTTEKERAAYNQGYRDAWLVLGQLLDNLGVPKSDDGADHRIRRLVEQRKEQV